MMEALRKIGERLPPPRMTRLRNTALFDWMNTNAPGKRVLNLGSGIGLWDKYLSSEVQTTNLDVAADKPGLHVLADAHRLPFCAGSFDVVYSIAVLEHCRRPWVVAAEIERVLRPGGSVVLEVPFLNVVHDEHDYFRFTDRGLRSLFDRPAFEVVLEQVGSGGGSFLSVFLYRYTQCFVPTRALRQIWSIIQYPLSLFRFLDVLIDRSPLLRLTANSFSFVARKR